jgi:hypothetical protein
VGENPPTYFFENTFSFNENYHGEMTSTGIFEENKAKILR